jgi:hypothetical protein
LTINDAFSEDLNIDNNVDNINIIVDRLIIEDYSDEETNQVKRLKDSLLLAFKI